MQREFISIEKIRDIDNAMLKFVKVSGEFRFINNKSRFSHIDMVKEEEYSVVEGAGTIWIKANGKWCFEGYYSMTLEGAGIKKNSVTEEIAKELEIILSPREYDN